MIFCWLLVAGVNVDQVDKLGRTALFTACLEGHENVAEVLLKYGADVNLLVLTCFYAQDRCISNKETGLSIRSLHFDAF